MNLIDLAALIFMFNILTFGNGPVMLPLLQANLVEERGLLTVDQLLYAFAIARITPGQANVYVAAIGYMLFGFPGAVLTTLAILLPGYAMLPLLQGFKRLQTVKGGRGLTRGLTSTSVGLICAAAFQIGRHSLTNPIAWIVFPLTLILVYILKWNPIVSLVIASAVGLLLNLWR
jgi:chromate transporter